MTPEGKVKAKVKRVLKKRGDDLYQFWPVQTGYGVSTLDCLGSYFGYSFAIETKAPGKKPTARQKIVIDEMTAARIEVFVIDGKDEQFVDLNYWLDWAKREYESVNFD